MPSIWGGQCTLGKPFCFPLGQDLTLPSDIVLVIISVKIKAAKLKGEMTLALVMLFKIKENHHFFFRS